MQDTALRFRQDCEQLLAKHSLLGVARGEYPPRALAVEENFPLELLPPLDHNARLDIACMGLDALETTVRAVGHDCICPACDVR